ncbi:neuroguidin isoform 4-T5 [Hipposideros larvatus]
MLLVHRSRKEVLESDLQSAQALLKNLQEQVMAVTAQVQALTKKVQSGAYPTEKGLSLLEVKDQLLLMYLMDLSHLILEKASGESLQGHAAVLRLVEIRTVLEKLRPLDQKLKYQIDKLVKTAVTGSLGENDPLRFKPHPSNMMSKLTSEDEEEVEAEEGQPGASGKKSANGAVKKYVPPRLVPVHYDETEAEREKKRLERAKRRALSSSVIRELKEQYSDAPEEIRDARNPHVTRQSQEDQHRINYEESMMVRLSVSKREKGRRKRANVMSSQLHSLTHFSDISALTGGTPNLDEDQNPIKRKKIPKKGQKKKGMGSGATDGERHEDTKEEVRHCQDPKEEGWRGWQSAWPPASLLLKMAKSPRLAAEEPGPGVSPGPLLTIWELTESQFPYLRKWK